MKQRSIFFPLQFIVCKLPLVRSGPNQPLGVDSDCDTSSWSGVLIRNPLSQTGNPWALWLTVSKKGQGQGLETGLHSHSFQGFLPGRVKGTCRGWGLPAKWKNRGPQSPLQCTLHFQTLNSSQNT